MKREEFYLTSKKDMDTIDSTYVNYGKLARRMIVSFITFRLAIHDGFMCVDLYNSQYICFKSVRSSVVSFSFTNY